MDDDSTAVARRVLCHKVTDCVVRYQRINERLDTIYNVASWSPIAISLIAFKSTRAAFVGGVISSAGLWGLYQVTSYNYQRMFVGQSAALVTSLSDEPVLRAEGEHLAKEFLSGETE
jgi:hypothetical protein